MNNDLPQGSVLVPIAFNLYLCDILITSSEKFLYDDEIALAFPHSYFEISEQTLSGVYILVLLKSRLLDSIGPIIKNLKNWKQSKISVFIASFHAPFRWSALEVENEI